jgi:nicotinamide mononucleotide transporter
MEQLLQDAAATFSWWEATAVALGIAYLLLAVRESLWCWYAAAASTAIFLFLFWDVSLLMESGLQVYYLAMAGYGWWQWQHGDNSNKPLQISRWSAPQHLAAISLVLIAAALSGRLLDLNTAAALPYLDSFTTWGAVLTTWMVARKVLENWLYWLVIDAVSIGLYLERGLYLTALLFMVYIVIACYGFWQWRKHYLKTQT